jgi:mRNA interferase MazF
VVEIYSPKGNKTKGYVMIDQIRTVDKRRISKIFGELSEKEIQKVKSVIKETFVD